MNRGFLFLLMACALPGVIADCAHAEIAHTPGASSTLAGPAADDSKANHYYVDCAAVETKGDGHSPRAAWHSVAEVNAHTFVAGDVIYLKRDSECHGMLWPKGSGSSSSTIRLTSYGQGARPRVVVGKADEEAFKLFDQEFWDVDSVEFSGGTLFGVFVSGQSGVLHHIHLRNLVVHDVYGGDVKHKESGLVVISPGKVEQHFDDVLVEGTTAWGTDQWAGILVGGGNFGDVEEKDWNTHVVVRNSVVHDLYGDGIILFRVKNGLIDSSVAWHIGMQPTQSIGTPNAIWTWMCEDCIVSNNEAFLTDSPGVDGGAFDIDYGNTRNSVVANYGHDTQGYCIAVFAAGYVTHDSVVEGNLCVGNGESPRLARLQGAIFLWTWNNGIIENLRVEKNTVYWDPPGDFPAIVNRADIRGEQKILASNRIYSAASSVIESNKNIALRNNTYVTCGDQRTSWTFNARTYSNFNEYRSDSSEEQGSTWKSDLSSLECLRMNYGHLRQLTNRQPAARGGRTASGLTPEKWTVVAHMPMSIDVQGLPDFPSAGQLVVLKNLGRQFQTSGLIIRASVDPIAEQPSESMANIIRDVGMSDLETSTPTRDQPGAVPVVQLVAPDGAIAREWHSFVGVAEIGLAVREVLGKPNYSRLALEQH